MANPAQLASRPWSNVKSAVTPCWNGALNFTCAIRRVGRLPALAQSGALDNASAEGLVEKQSKGYLGTPCPARLCAAGGGMEGLSC